MSATFDATGDYLDLASFTLPQSAGSVSVWWKPSFAWNDSTRHTIFHASDGTNFFHMFKHTDNNLWAGWHVAPTSYRVSTAASGLVQDSWNHLLVTWDDTANETKLYLANSQIGSTVTSLVTWDTSGATATYLGNRSPLDADARGDLAEFAIYNTVLDAGQRNALYKGFSPYLVAKPFRYFPMVRSFQELMVAGSITNTGVTIGTHPPIRSPSTRKAA